MLRLHRRPWGRNAARISDSDLLAWLFDLFTKNIDMIASGDTVVVRSGRQAYVATIREIVYADE